MSQPLSALGKRLPVAIRASETEALQAAVIATLFGIFLLFGVGFAHSDRLHTATHDTRHTFTFPCH